MTRLLAFTIPLLLLFGLSLVTGYRPFYFFLYFVLVLLAFSYLWTWLQTRGLEVRVESLSTRPQVGHALNLRITVREKLGIPRMALKFKLLAGPVRGGRTVTQHSAQGLIPMDGIVAPSPPRYQCHRFPPRHGDRSSGFGHAEQAGWRPSYHNGAPKGDSSLVGNIH